MIQQPVEQPRQKIPKDGPGPRGGADVYYTSRVLDSTFRYVKYIKKLRAQEEEERKGDLNKLRELKDVQNNDFFIRCDRRGLINNVARRVDRCLASYQQDLEKKKVRLKDLLQKEEQSDIRKFVEQAQAGEALVWEEKMERLRYLLEKRKKEHEEKFKDTPLSKCTHVLPCIVKARALEAQEIQLYQMKEKAAKKMAEKEFDKMWHEMGMRESEALAARMEHDTIERLRKDLEAKVYSDRQLEENRIRREKEKEYLKKEALWFRSIWNEDIRKEQEAENQRKEKRMKTGRERKKMIEDRQEVVAKQQAAERLINNTWDDLTKQGLSADQDKLELMRKKERDLDECNRQIVRLRDRFQGLECLTDAANEREAQRLQDITDNRRCAVFRKKLQNTKDLTAHLKQQMKEKAENVKEKTRQAEADNYNAQIAAQGDALLAYKELMDAQRMKTYQNHLLDQIAYNDLLKERERKEELEQQKKADKATEEYQEEIERMMSRRFFSDEVHPFMKQMARGVTMNKCPCSRPDYCGPGKSETPDNTKQ